MADTMLGSEDIMKSRSLRPYWTNTNTAEDDGIHSEKKGMHALFGETILSWDLWLLLCLEGPSDLSSP